MRHPSILLLAAALLAAVLAGCASAGVNRVLEVPDAESAAPKGTPSEAARKAVIPAPAATPSLPVAAPVDTVPDDSTVTKVQAESIALKQAGFTADQVTGLRSRYEVDGGIPQYDVEFREGDTEYEFEIHAQTGQILSCDRDALWD